MNIRFTNPPHNIRERCEAAFDLTDAQPVWTYGDTIYNPFDAPMDIPMEAHEATHMKQQGDHPEEWYEQYLKDPVFRYDQELEAFRAQFQEAKNLSKDRELLSNYVRLLAQALSSPMYGKLSTVSESIKAIKRKG